MDGAALNKFCVSYQIYSDYYGDAILTVKVKLGKMFKGKTTADTLTGTSNSDIFFEGKGKDTFKGMNRHDVAVYNKTAWGKDTIAATKGTMTLVLGGIKKSNVTLKLKGDTMVVTRKGVQGQSITIKGWSADTHKIVYNKKLTAFTKYLNATSPTAKMKQAAQNEVWKHAGLTSKA